MTSILDVSFTTLALLIFVAGIVLGGVGAMVYAQLVQMHRELAALVGSVGTIKRMEGEQMSLAQELLEAVTRQTTLVSSFIELVDGLVRDNTIPPEAAAAIKAKLAESAADIEAAIAANTPSAPPPVEPPAEG